MFILRLVVFALLHSAFSRHSAGCLPQAIMSPAAIAS